MKIGDMIESKYMKQSDIPDPVIYTVESLKKVNVARDDEDPDYRWTVKYREFAKPMVLNVTNLKRMAKALGDDTDDWTGKQIEVYTDPDIEFGGNIVGGLRVRGLKRSPGTAKAAALSKRSDDDINAQLRDAGENEVPF